MKKKGEPQPQPNQIIESCESTNLLAKAWVEQGRAEDTWICARRQSAGRGRMGREWISDHGNLYLSYIARVDNPAYLTWLPLATAVALHEVVRNAASQAQDVKIKWPNDLWFETRKLAGVLCEHVAGPYGLTVVGLGLNLQKAPPTGAALAELTASAPVLEDLLPEVLSGMRRWYRELNSRGPSQIEQEYTRHALFKKGTAVEWGQADRSEVGVVKGLGQHGELIVSMAGGKERALFAEDVFQVRTSRV